jgi:hypothetical protein
MASASAFYNDVIQVTALVFIENFSADRAIAVTVDGGYACDFGSNPNKSTIKGAPQIKAGTVML